MRRTKVISFLLWLVIVFSLVAYSASPKPVELIKLNDYLWIHTSYENYNGYLVPSNGLVVETEKGLIMIDTCWNNESTTELLKMGKVKFSKDFMLAIITHGAHADRIGGIGALHQAGIEVISTKLIAEKAIAAGYQQPLPKLDPTTNLMIGNVKLETYFPGAGHTVDNIVVWFPASRVLFAGCSIKSIDSKDLGNLADADVKEWPNSLKNILKKYPDVSIVIPGHGNWGDAELIKHTLKLFPKS